MAKVRTRNHGLRMSSVRERHWLSTINFLRIILGRIRAFPAKQQKYQFLRMRSANFCQNTDECSTIAEISLAELLKL